MSNKMKPNELRSLLVSSGNLVPTTTSIPQAMRTSNAKESQAAAIAARRAELGVKTIVSTKGR